VLSFILLISLLSIICYQSSITIVILVLYIIVATETALFLFKLPIELCHITHKNRARKQSSSIQNVLFKY